MGRESPEKAFHRWMKIFETFPEGIALVRGGYLLYANRALKYILNVGLERAADADPSYELLRSDLKIAVVEQWIKSAAQMKRMGLKRPRQMSIWHFLMSDERGTIFKLLPRRGPLPSHLFSGSNADFDAKSALPPEEGLIQDLNDDLIAEMPKYLTLNQIAVKIAGGIDKLLIVRDVTSVVLNENIMEIKRQMGKLTDTLLREVDDHSNVVEQKLQKLDQHINDGNLEGEKLNDESISEIKKMQYRIKDFQQVYFVSENKIRHQSNQVSLQSCIKDVIQLVQSDIAERNVDLQLSIDNNVPDQIAIDAQKLKQVILNLLLQNFYNLQDITVKINVSLKELASEDDPDRLDPFIMIEIENSQYVVKKKDVRRLERLDATRDFQTILESKVDVNFKIAKILTNAIGWRVDFEDFQEGKQTLLIPAKKFVDANNVHSLHLNSTIKEEGEESSKDEIKKEDPPPHVDDGSQSGNSDNSQLKLESSILQQYAAPERVETIDLDAEDGDRRARLRLRAEQRKAFKQKQAVEDAELQKKTAAAREKILVQEQKMKDIESQIKS